MKITVESTNKIVAILHGGVDVPARIWEGHTDSGIPVHCYVTRVGVAEDLPPETYAQFERELEATRKPSPAIEAIPMRMIL